MPEQIKYIMAVDAGRSNLHISVYRHELGSKNAPECVKDFPNIPNEDFVSRRDSLRTERIAGVYGAVTGVLASLDPKVKRNMARIVVDSHGAAADVLDENGNEFFTQIYDQEVKELRPAFHQICGSQDSLYLETSTPALPYGVNWLTQIHYLLEKHSDFMRGLKGEGQITSVAGYIASRFTGISSTDATHIGNHGYAMNYKTGELSSAVENLGTRYNNDITSLIGHFIKTPYEPVGTIKTQVAKDYGLNRHCKVISVSHDSSLAAVLAQIGGFDTMDSSGTWSVLMSPNKEVELQTHMQQWDMTVNRDIFGAQLPTAMFRGGQMWAGYMKLGNQDADYDTQLDIEVLNHILEGNIFVRPAFMDGAGPYKHSTEQPMLSDELRKDPVKLAHTVQLALAIQSAFSEAASSKALSEDASIEDILSDNRGSGRILVAGPYTQGLARDVLNMVTPKEMYVVDDKTPVNLAGALVGVASIEGVKPDELEIEGLPFNHVKAAHTGFGQRIIQYARNWENWVRTQTPK